VKTSWVISHVSLKLFSNILETVSVVRGLCDDRYNCPSHCIYTLVTSWKLVFLPKNGPLQNSGWTQVLTSFHWFLMVLLHRSILVARFQDWLGVVSCISVEVVGMLTSFAAKTVLSTKLIWCPASICSATTNLSSWTVEVSGGWI
jgi:hypothetical protein